MVKVANIQHLATPVIAQLAEPRSAVELAGLLHPTPAVGGEPHREAAAAIGELEQMDRGWYAGPVGWMDATEDGEFCVALRSALLRDREAHLYRRRRRRRRSDPAAELEETEIKLQALLPLVADLKVALAGVCTTLLVIGVAAAPAAAPPGPRLAFVEYGRRPGRLELKSVDASGGEPLRLAGGALRTVPLPGGLEPISWSADGEHIAFTGIERHSEELGSGEHTAQIYLAWRTAAA